MADSHFFAISLLVYLSYVEVNQVYRERHQRMNRLYIYNIVMDSSHLSMHSNTSHVVVILWHKMFSYLLYIFVC